VTLLVLVGVGLAVSVAIPTNATGAVAASSVTGTWGLYTNDCFFGQCNYRLYLVQHASTVTGRNRVSGTVSGNYIEVDYTGVSSEGDWSCMGTINMARTRFHGTFTDGLGGSGFCNAWRIAA
jgi:hypothetical protein